MAVEVSASGAGDAISDGVRGGVSGGGESISSSEEGGDDKGDSDALIFLVGAWSYLTERIVLVVLGFGEVEGCSLEVGALEQGEMTVPSRPVTTDLWDPYLMHLVCPSRKRWTED